MLSNGRTSSAIEIRRADILSSVAGELIRALNAELMARYPEPGANHFQLDAEEVAEGRGGFFIAYIEEKPVGCGAVRRLESLVAEIKRMYVAPEARGMGIGRQILDALEAEAQKLGARRIVLETGPRQPEAIALYSRAGFLRIPLFGEYLQSPDFSVCMAKDL
jgi:GNAT superfamily N-acetyltransferase